MGDNEDINDEIYSGEEDMYEHENGKKFKKCRGCNRPLTKHPGPFGAKNCTNEVIEGQELREYIQRLKEDLRREQVSQMMGGGGCWMEGSCSARARAPPLASLSRP